MLKNLRYVTNVIKNLSVDAAASQFPEISFITKLRSWQQIIFLIALAPFLQKNIPPASKMAYPYNSIPHIIPILIGENIGRTYFELTLNLLQAYYELTKTVSSKQVLTLYLLWLNQAFNAPGGILE